MAIPRNTCQATLTFEGENSPTPCPLGETSGIIMSINETGGTFWDVALGTPNNPFTNPSMFDLSIGDQICVNESGEVITFMTCPISAQFLLDGEPMTNPFSANLSMLFPACPFVPIELLQIFINNAVLPGITIAVNFSPSGGGVGTFTVVVTKQSNTVLIGTVELIVVFEGTPFPIASAPLVCNLRRRKRKLGVPLICIPDIKNPNKCNWQVFNSTK